MAIEMSTVTLDGVEYQAQIESEVREVKGESTIVHTRHALEQFNADIALQVIEARAMGPEAAGFIRAQVPVTATEIAKALGVSRKSFYRWSKGIDPMPPAVWFVLATIVRERVEGSNRMHALLMGDKAA